MEPVTPSKRPKTHHSDLECTENSLNEEYDLSLNRPGNETDPRFNSLDSLQVLQFVSSQRHPEQFGEQPPAFYPPMWLHQFQLEQLLQAQRMVPRSPEVPRFELKHQPSARQKPGKPMSPQPINVCLRPEVAEEVSLMTECWVTARLGNERGEEVRTEGMLEGLKGTLTQPLDSKGLASFFLVLTPESKRFHKKKLCLLFVVRYSVPGMGEFAEQLVSKPFAVTIPQPRNDKTHPIVFAMKPKEGPPTSTESVWIKGSKFKSPVEVKFGEQVAKVEEVTPTIIVVTPPVRSDIQETTPVTVTVSNVNSKGHPNTATHQLVYVYKPM